MKSTWWSRMGRGLLPLIIVATAIAAAAAMIASREEAASTPVAERVVAVETMTVRSSDRVFSVASQGTVQPRTQTTLVAEVSGVVDSVSDAFVVGGFFREGEVLLTLDPADYEVAVDQARANLLAAEAQLAQEQAQAEQAGREWDLSGRPREEAPILALRTPQLREAEARVLSAESDLRQAERRLARTTIRAPYDALVREKSADVGQYIGGGAQLARIFATDYAEVRLPLADEDLAWLELPRPGQLNPDTERAVTLRATVAGQPQRWNATIVRTEGVIDSNSRMHHAVARIEDPYALGGAGDKTPLQAGTFVEARLEGISASGIFTLPHHALRNGGQVLLMDNEQRLRQRPVNVIRADTDRVYIDEGLSDGDIVIVSPVQVPVDGMRVRPRQAGS